MTSIDQDLHQGPQCTNRLLPFRIIEEDLSSTGVRDEKFGILHVKVFQPSLNRLYIIDGKGMMMPPADVPGLWLLNLIGILGTPQARALRVHVRL